MRVAGVFAVAVLTGCGATAPVKEEPPTVELGGACAATVAEVPRAQVPRPRPERVPRDFNEWSFEFQDIAGCHERSGVRVAAVAVDLGAAMTPMRFEIAVWTDEQGYAPPLDVSVYDADWGAVAEADFDEFSQRGTRFTHTLFTSGDRPVRFVVLSADPDSLDQSLTHVAGYSTQTMVYTAYGSMAIQGGGERQHDIKFANGGWFSVVPVLPETEGSE